ncbi:4612_t:CDS:2 [Racocetra persica]|uniref:4612_t:CDS:1 n=1 Tax=Racocetra persica TaxID=160502 RepID=A0ACA9P1R1_9GLOM|nr:4612_t:CDS:2 [Racocetra persica]
MNTQYCTAHKSISYKLVFGQLPHCDTNLANILENEKSLNNHTLVSEDSQSSIVSEINSETLESELNEIYFEKLQEVESELDEIYFEKSYRVDSDTEQNNYSDVDINETQEIDDVGEIQDNADEIQDNANEIQDDADKIKDDNDDYDIQKYYNSEIEECSKNTLTPEIIEIVDLDDDSSENQRYTWQEKEK